MTKPFTKIILLAMTFLLTISVKSSAQLLKQRNAAMENDRFSPTTSLDYEGVRKHFPNFSVPRMLSEQTERLKKPQEILREESRQGTTYSLSEMLRAAGVNEIWGNLIFQSGWQQDKPQRGMYSFKPSAPLVVNPLGIYENMVANYGSALVDDVYHVIYGDFKYAKYGLIMVYHYKFDPNDWMPIGSFTLLDKRYDLLAHELAYDRINDKIYGEFYSSDLQKNEFGIVDYNTLTRTTFGESTHKYAALGITKEGVLYGVAEDGNLYRIATDTGAETLVGATGVTISDANGQFYGQSGEIDQNTNTFYWACVDNDGKSALYTINLETGAAEKIGDFPKREEFHGLMFPAHTVEAGAPAEVQDLTIEFDGANHNGTMRFTLPTQTVDGKPLTGKLNYTAMQGKDVLQTADANPGEAITVTVNNAPDGMNVFSVVTKNDVGESAKAVKKRWVGYDVPMPARWVDFKLDEATGIVTLSWYEPQYMSHNGYKGTLTYDVVRMPDNVKVAENITETRITDNLGTTVKEKSWYYIIYVKNGDKVSNPKLSDSKLYGEGLEPPYLETFDTKESVSGYTILDKNGDYTKWLYDDDKKMMSCYHNKKKATDDWLITPKFKLEAGRKYTLSLKAAAFGTTHTERFEVKIGTDRTDEAMTIACIPPTNVKHKDLKTYTKEFTVPTNGNYFVGVHGISEPDMFGIFVDDIQIIPGSVDSAPKAVEELTATTDPTGANKTIIRFKTPTQTINGAALTAITKVVVSRDDNEIKVFDNPGIGATLSLEDNTAKNGFFTYKVVAYIGKEFGLPATLKTYVGFDTPATAKNRMLADLDGKVRFTWDKVSNVGANGGVVDPDKVKYFVYDVYQNAAGETVAAQRDSTTALEYVFEKNTEEGEQVLMQMGLAVENHIGRSIIVGSEGLPIGNPYTLPFKDGFAKTEKLWWTNQIGKGGFYLYTGKSSDQDNECVAFAANEKDVHGWLNSGKITLRGTVDPKLFFDYFCVPNKDIQLKVEIETPAKKAETIHSIDFKQESGEATWKQLRLDIPEKFANERYIFVKFYAIGSNTKEELYIDNVHLRDVLQYNLSTEIAAPELINKGETAEIKLKVSNEGSKPVERYKVNVQANGKLLKEEVIEEMLEPFTTKTLTYNYTNSVFENQQEILVKASADYRYDLERNDDATQTTIYIDNAELPAPNNVIAKVEASGETNLQWGAPTSTSKRVFEDFERYKAWSTNDLGKWTMVDGDKGATGSFSQFPFPHKGEAMAYIVFNPEAAGISTKVNAFLTPKSGNQYMASFYCYDLEAQEIIDQNNWLISPQLSGEAQTISVNLRNTKLGTENAPETYEIYYSNTGKAVADFHILQAASNVSSGNWEEINVDLPEGTKYFAIRQIGKDGFFFMIDDISFNIGAGELKGYNIYCDGKLVASLPANATSYGNNLQDVSKHKYHVTAVFTDGESLPQEALVVTNGIEMPTQEKAVAYDVYTLDGRLIGKQLKSLKNLPKGVYLINNEKKVIK